MICNFYPFNFVISYTNKLPILWFISWYHSNNDWKYYNTFLQSCTFNQDLKEQKWQQDYVWSLNEKTYFKKPNVNATIFPYPLYTSIVYGCSIPHRHSDATQMDKMCVQFLYARRTFQIVAVKGMLQEYWKIDMFLETFRLLACAISNFVWSPYKDFLTLDLGTW